MLSVKASANGAIGEDSLKALDVDARKETAQNSDASRTKDDITSVIDIKDICEKTKQIHFRATPKVDRSKGMAEIERARTYVCMYVCICV